MKNKIKSIIEHSIQVKQLLLYEPTLIKISEIVDVCVSAINSGKFIYFCGNGGSASQADHISAELTGKFYFDRKPLPSAALHTNTSYLTAAANDYGYDQVYSRLLEGIGKPGDALFGLSTSGKSKNIINAFIAAKKLGIHTIGLTGNSISEFNKLCDITINVPSNDIPRIQESHILIGHIICQLIEEKVMDAK